MLSLGARRGLDDLKIRRFEPAQLIIGDVALKDASRCLPFPNGVAAIRFDGTT